MMAAHSQGMPHAGMAYGQPMPGHAPNPAQAMAHMQMHPGASAPGAPHVSQAGAMMGMQPGMPGPNAHALQHLTPQGPMMQQPQMPPSFPANNPAALQAFQARQQQQMMLQQQRQQQQQQMMHGGPHQGGANMGFGAAGNPQFAAQQFAQMQQQGGVHLTPNIAQQQAAIMQQRAMMHQQQVHAQAQAQAQQHAAQQQAQQQALANSQHLAMQQATSQSSNQGQNTPQPQQAQHPPQPQMRPQPPVTTAPEAHSSPAQPPNPQQNTSQPPQAAAQAPQPPTSQPQAGQQGQQAQQNQAAGLQQQQQRAALMQQQQQQQAQQAQAQQQAQQQQAQQQAQQQQSQQQTQQQQQQQQTQQQQQQQQTQQQQQVQAQAQAHAQVQQQMQARTREMLQAKMQGQTGRLNGASTLRLYQFADHISRYKASEQTNRDEQFWRDFVDRFFAPDSSLRHVVKDLKQDHTKQYEVLFPSLPRYFHVHYESIDQMQIFIEQPTERGVNPPNATQPGVYIVEALRAKFIYWFKNETQLVCSGKIWAIFTDDKIATLHFETQDYQQYVPRNQVELAFARTHVNASKSPRMTKKGGANQRNQPRPNDPSPSMADIPEAPLGYLGVTKAVQSFFELNEIFSMMSAVMRHVQDNPGMTPNDALQSLASDYANAQNAAGNAPGPHINLPPNGNPMQMMQQQASMPPGATTPGQGGMQQNMPQNFMSSPAMPHQFLPGGGVMPMNGGGSPHINLNAGLNPGAHTPSPAQTHMQAPAMVQQMSAQGSTGSAASVNTSPNMAGAKRRRPSAVKTEDEGGGPEVNGIQGKVKQSPRVGQNKRIKGS